MKLRTRIIIAFFTIILVPMSLILISMYFLTQYQMDKLHSEYGIERSYDSYSSVLKRVNRATEGIFLLIDENAKDDPGVFEQQNFLETMNQRLVSRHSYLLVRKGKEIYYNGTDKDISYLKEYLPEFSEAGAAYNSMPDSYYLGGDLQVLIKQSDFYFLDGTPGSAFVVTNANAFLPLLEEFVKDVIVILLLALLVTSIVMILWLYRDVIISLDRLTRAARNIRDGQLDFTLGGSKVKEMDDLCRDFEEMRKQLKVTAEEKENFDLENRELLRNISHDLRTPITSIRGYVEGVMDGVADSPEKIDRYMRTILTKTKEMDRLITELTVYAHIGSNRIPYNFSTVSVYNFFQDCVEDIGTELASRGVRFVWTNSLEQDVKIVADLEQISRVVNNIISNSLKYMDKEERRVEMRMLDAGDFVQFEIQDNGKGIAAKDLPSIFDRFYRTDASRNSSQGGSGIGLSIVKKILDDHGGRVWALSRVGEGTTICFVIRKYQEVRRENEQDIDRGRRKGNRRSGKRLSGAERL